MPEDRERIGRSPRISKSDLARMEFTLGMAQAAADLFMVANDMVKRGEASSMGVAVVYMTEMYERIKANGLSES